MLAEVDSTYVERSIDRSLMRLGVERLDLVQFHWWDYEVPGYVEAAAALSRLRDKGKIANIGVTNFDVPRLREILDAGVPVVSMQAQYSLLDERPRNGMIDLCRERNIGVICYGTVAGGFPVGAMGGAARASRRFDQSILDQIQIDHRRFRRLGFIPAAPANLGRVAVRHRCDIATVASRTVLDRDQVAAIIVGATNASHLGASAKSPIWLHAADEQAIQALLRQRQGPYGDVYSLERDRTGRHGRIMKYDLHRKNSFAG